MSESNELSFVSGIVMRGGRVAVVQRSVSFEVASGILIHPLDGVVGAVKESDKEIETRGFAGLPEARAMTREFFLQCRVSIRPAAWRLLGQKKFLLSKKDTVSGTPETTKSYFFAEYPSGYQESDCAHPLIRWFDIKELADPTGEYWSQVPPELKTSLFRLTFDPPAFNKEPFYV